jgi:hypothetical protein
LDVKCPVSCLGNVEYMDLTDRYVALEKKLAGANGEKKKDM